MFKLMVVKRRKATQFDSYASLKAALRSAVLMDFPAWYVIG